MFTSVSSNLLSLLSNTVVYGSSLHSCDSFQRVPQPLRRSRRRDFRFDSDDDDDHLPEYEAPDVTENRVRGVAQEFCQRWAKDHGYRIVVKASSGRKERKHWRASMNTVYLVCARSGQPRRKPGAKSNYNSSKCGCPFEITLALRDGHWFVEYNNEDVYHNHD